MRRNHRKKECLVDIEAKIIRKTILQPWKKVTKKHYLRAKRNVVEVQYKLDSSLDFLYEFIEEEKL